MTSAGAENTETSTRPVLRVISGNATAEEIAVLTAIVAVSGGEDEPAPRERRGGWNDPAWQMRRQLHPGPNGWNGSLR